MDVLDHLQKGKRFHDVAVVAAAALPEAIVHVTVGLTILQFFQKRGRVLPQVFDGLAMDGGFKSRANAADFVCRLLGPDEYVDMFRHDHIRPNIELMPSSCRFQGIHEPPPSPILGQQRLSEETRKRQLVRMTGKVVALDSFSMVCGHGWPLVMLWLTRSVWRIRRWKARRKPVQSPRD